MFDFEKALDDQIQASIKDLKKKQSKASFRDNAEVVDKLTKLKRGVSFIWPGLPELRPFFYYLTILYYRVVLMASKLSYKAFIF